MKFKLNIFMLTFLIFSSCHQNNTGSNTPSNEEGSNSQKLTFSQEMTSNNFQLGFPEQAIASGKTRTFKWTIRNNSNSSSNPLSFSSNSLGNLVINDNNSTCIKTNHVMNSGDSCSFEFTYTAPTKSVLIDILSRATSC